MKMAVCCQCIILCFVVLQLKSPYKQKNTIFRSCNLRHYKTMFARLFLFAANPNENKKEKWSVKIGNGDYDFGVRPT